MVTDALAAPGGSEKSREHQAVAVVSAAHFVNHFQHLVLPPLFPLLTAQLGVGFVEIGFALTLSNIVAVAAQLPVGFLVDRLGSRRMLVVALLVAGLAFVAFGLDPSYSRLLIAMTFVGLANSVFHPADYAILSATIPPARLGRAFSVHTFAGFLGNAVAPVTMLAITAFAGLGVALMAAGIIGILAALPLALVRVDSAIVPARAAPGEARRATGLTSVLTPTILGLTAFFSLMSLSGSGMGSFSVVALTAAYDTPLSIANLALTAFLTAQAFGVLAGGFIADTTRRHAEIASVGYAINAAVVAVIGFVWLETAALVAAMAIAGLLSGVIMPSRDMLVRAAAPAGAIGRTFGIVTAGFSIGGMIGPLLFGFIMDQGAPRWVFGVSMILMVLTAIVALVGDRRALAKRRHSIAPVAGAAE